MLYFSSRSKARNFAAGKRKVIDLLIKGVTTPDKRWAVKVL